MTTNPTTGVEAWAGQDTGDWTEPMQAALLDLTARSTEKPHNRRARPPKVLRRAIEMLRTAIREEGYDPDVKRTGIVGGPIPREDVAHGTTIEVFPRAS